MKKIIIQTIILTFLLVSGTVKPIWAQSPNVTAYGNYKVEEKKGELELHTLQTAKRSIELQYRKMELAQQNLDIQTMLSLTHPDYKAYASNGDVWDIKKLEAYWAAGLKNVVSTEVLANNIKSFTLKNDTAVIEVNQVWKRKQWMAGKIREVSTDAYQTEIWLHTLDGWKRWKIENVSNNGALVDGKRVDITKPYDPNAPEYKPEAEKY